MQARPLATARRAVTDRRTRPAPRPPAGTPAAAELARQARAVLADAVRVARWTDAERARGGSCGPGRPGPLPAPVAERAAAALGLTPGQVRAGWDRARLAGLVELHGATVRPGWRLRAWDRDDAAVLRGWVALFDAWSLVHPAPDDIAPTAVAEVVEAVPQVLSLLQLSNGPVLVPALLDLLGQRVAELREERCEVPYGPQPDPVSLPPLLPHLLGWALAGLAAVGALVLGEGQATLTPLGNWAVWVKLEQICVAAQSPAGNIEQSADDMLRGCAGLTRARPAPSTGPGPPPVPSAAPSPNSSTSPGVTTPCCADSPSRRCGSSEHPPRPGCAPPPRKPACAPTPCCGSPSTRAATPRTCSVSSPARSPPGCGSTRPPPWPITASELLVRHLDSAVQGTVPALLDEVRAVGHPRTVQVLVALAAAHPDPALAKAVRRAAFQVHTGSV